MRIPRAFALALLSSVACADDPVAERLLPEGCGVPRACQVEGVDLVVEPPVLLDSTAERVDGRPMLAPGSVVQVSAEVWNRGTEAMDSAVLRFYWRSSPLSYSGGSVDVPLGPLAPGEMIAETASVAVPEELGLRRDQIVFIAYIRQGWPEDDPFYSNDDAGSDPALVPLPVIEGEVRAPTSEFEMYVPDTLMVTLTNRSPVAPLEASTLFFCLYDYDVGCNHAYGEPFGLQDFDRLEPGETWADTLEVVLTKENANVLWTTGWNLYACIGPPAATVEDVDEWSEQTCVGKPYRISVRPNLQGACEPNVVRADTTVLATDFRYCENPAGPADLELLALDVTPGDTLTLDSADGIGAVLLNDGSHVNADLISAPEDPVVRHRLVAEANRYYLTSPPEPGQTIVIRTQR